MDCDILGALLEQVSLKTRMTNPEIAHQAHGLSKVFTTAEKFMREQVLDAIQATRDLLDSAVF
jgi:hypothetical protein